MEDRELVELIFRFTSEMDTLEERFYPILKKAEKEKPENSCDYLFTLMLRNGEWKINSFKTKVHAPGRVWKNGCF